MMDPPRHTCRGRPMVCPGPCNPLKAHHHHHHRHHHCQKPDMTRVTVPGNDIPLSNEFSQVTQLKSSKTDISVATLTDKSISIETSSTKIALIQISKISQHKETDIHATLQQILPPEKLAELLYESSKPKTEKIVERKIEKTSESPALLKKIEPPILTRTISQPKETAVRILAAYRPPWNLNDICAIMTRLNRLIPKGTSTLFLCLTILLIYAGIHVLLAIMAWQTPAYEFFAFSQICGVFAFLMWRLTGTILI